LTEKKKILVTGSNGQVGSEFQTIKDAYPRYSFIFLSKSDLDISNPVQVEKTVTSHNPDYLINCAAYTAVDKAEEDKETAYRINVEAVGILASICTKLGVKLVHISTDYVFDGKSQKPYTEDDPVKPINTYGETKLLGELQAMSNCSDSIIIRTSWVYSSYGNNFVKTMIRLLTEKEEIRVIEDQIGSPTYAADLADTIMQIIDSGKWIPGIYNYSNEGKISWYEFASEIKVLIHSYCRIIPITTAEYPTAARRPKFSLLSKDKIEKVYGVNPKDWKQSLKNCINKMPVD
jgi:dTDP-4-dehydrorhamnose reductase